MAEEIKKMDLESKDLIAERIEQLKKLFPEIATEGDGSVDFEKLRLILGDEIEEGDERYTFTWPGKMDAIRQSQTPSKATLRPCIEKSRGRDGKDGSFDSDNLYIEGDNLEVLKLLQRSYHGKVKMIFIDPPYNTGNDFVYEDSFGDTIENYKKQAGTSQQSNSETNGRFHSNWCSLMYPRLKLAYELLSEDGAIFISIDDNEERNLRLICDEIFGDNNYVATLSIVVKPEGRAYGGFARTHQYTLVYAKNLARVALNEISIEGKKFEYVDEKGGFNIKDLRNGNPRAFNSQNRPNLRYPFYVDESDIDENGFLKVYLEKRDNCSEVYPITVNDLKCVWRWGKYEKASRQIEDLIGKKGRDGIIRIYQKTRKLTAMPKTVLVDAAYSSNKGTRELESLIGPGVFDFPKPSKLITYFCEIATRSNSLILDFFSGSGTTAHAVIDLNAKDGGNRKFILVQLPETTDSNSEAFKNGYETICEIGEERIRRAGDKLKEEIEKENLQLPLDGEAKRLPDIGFRVLKLDESGIAEPDPGQLLVDLVKDGRSNEDIIFEVMLKWGYELTYPIEKGAIEGYPYYSVASDSLICCMDENLTTDALEGIAELEPDRVFILDSAFGGSDSLKLNAIQIFKRAGERFRKSIELRTV